LVLKLANNVLSLVCSHAVMDILSCTYTQTQTLALGIRAINES
jgi:hypothetical protein